VAAHDLSIIVRQITLPCLNCLRIAEPPSLRLIEMESSCITRLETRIISVDCCFDTPLVESLLGKSVAYNYRITILAP
jgi:hypothetical protein